MQSITLEQIQREQVKTVRLRFTPVIEAVYRLEAIQDQLNLLLINSLVGLILFDSFAVSDYFAAGIYFKYYLIGRLGIATPICLLFLSLIWIGSKYHHLFVCLNIICMTVINSALIIISSGQYRLFYLFATSIMMVAGYVIGRPRFPYAVATIAIQGLCYEVTVWASDLIALDSVLPSTLFCVSCALIAVMTAFALERSDRRAFLMSLHVRLMNRELQVMAKTDPLTGLGNRRLLEDTSALIWVASAAETRLVSLILIDIDLFKAFNDNYGHLAGDQCLKMIGRCIAGTMRGADDLAVRFGGEEIAVLLPDTDFTEARRLAEDIRLAIRMAAIPHPVLGPHAIVTASLGVATAPTSASTMPELVVRADTALYAAKHNGRDQVWPPLGQAAIPSAGIALAG